jgi:uncharacterized membrane protein YeaQ/YmgE (transglycosylase-associated protein family)
MELVGALLALAVQGLVVGALARLAIPGPDPMPWWLTLTIGLVGSLVGGTIGYGLGGLSGAFLGAVIVAAVVVVGYRRVVQRRGITGPGAHVRPTWGFGLRRR